MTSKTSLHLKHTSENLLQIFTELWKDCVPRKDSTTKTLYIMKSIVTEKHERKNY
jgi:hypothetical protein